MQSIENEHIDAEDSETSQNGELDELWMKQLEDQLPPWLVKLSRSLCKNFLIGFTWQLLLQAFPIILRGKLSQLKTLSSGENFKGFCQRGALLGAWVVQFRLLMKLFVNNGVKNQKSPLGRAQHCNKVAVCGFLSGATSMYTIGGLHWSMCLYFACRAVRGIFDLAYYEHWFPEWCEKFPTWLLFGIICGPTASHTLLFKTKHAPKGYIDFVKSACGKNMDQMTFMYQNSFEKCQPCHPRYHEGPCFQANFKSLRGSLTYLMKFYVVFYSVFRVLLRSPKQLLKSPLDTLKSIIRNSIGSSVFVTSVGWAACLLPCIYRPLGWKLNFWTVIPWCSFTALGLYFEASSRQSELMVYNISSTIEGFINYFYDYNTRIYPALPTPPFLSNILASLLFGFASAAWVWARERAPQSMKNTEKKILNHVLPLEPKYVTFDETSENPLIINELSADEKMCQLLTEDGEMQVISVRRMEKLLEQERAVVVQENPCILRVKREKTLRTRNSLRTDVLELLVSSLSALVMQTTSS